MQHSLRFPPSRGSFNDTTRVMVSIPRVNSGALTCRRSFPAQRQQITMILSRSIPSPPIQFAISWFAVNRGSTILILPASFARGIRQFVGVGLQLQRLLSWDGLFLIQIFCSFRTFAQMIRSRSSKTIFGRSWWNIVTSAIPAVLPSCKVD